jgi:hypothetical protein
MLIKVLKLVYSIVFACETALRVKIKHWNKDKEANQNDCGDIQAGMKFSKP